MTHRGRRIAARTSDQEPARERHPARPRWLGRARPDRSSTHRSATLRVVDQGDGFPADFRDRAFEPFTRADPARDLGTGTAGLGLVDRPRHRDGTRRHDRRRRRPGWRGRDRPTRLTSAVGVRPRRGRVGQAVDQRLGVRRETWALPVPPQGTRPTHPRWQLDLHAAVARQVHRVGRVQPTQRLRDRVDLGADVVGRAACVGASGRRARRTGGCRRRGAAIRTVRGGRSRAR